MPGPTRACSPACSRRPASPISRSRTTPRISAPCCGCSTSWPPSPTTSSSSSVSSVSSSTPSRAHRPICTRSTGAMWPSPLPNPDRESRAPRRSSQRDIPETDPLPLRWVCPDGVRRCISSRRGRPLVANISKLWQYRVGSLRSPGWYRAWRTEIEQPLLRSVACRLVNPHGQLQFRLHVGPCIPRRSAGVDK
ncbi:hypothetical protein VTK56DRAFT_9744 [Thermocarpiscus australiensis]